MVRMNRPLLLMLVAGCFLGSSRGYSDPESISLCEVRSHLAEYMNKTLVIRGVLVSHEHGAWLEASMSCDSEGSIPSLRLEGGIDFASYMAAGGMKGHGVSATVKGKVVKSNRPRATEPVFWVGRVRYETATRESK